MDAEGNRKFSRANSGLVFESFQLLDPTTAPVLIIVASDASFHGNVTQHPLFCEYLHCYESSLITEFYFQTVPSTCTNQNDPKPLLGFHLLGCQLISKPWRQTDHQKASMAMQHAGLGWNTRPYLMYSKTGMPELRTQWPCIGEEQYFDNQGFMWQQWWSIILSWISLQLAVK